MKVLITGSNGYIGRVMSAMFVRAGHDAVGMDCDWFASCEAAGGDEPVPSIRKDIRDAERDDFVGFDAVVHLAAICNDPMGDLDPQVTMEINYAASLRFAELARDAGVRRFLLSSSCSIYGGSGEHPIDETGQVAPLTVYARSKVLLEKGLGELASDTFCPVFLRNATAYGMSPALRLDLVLNDFVASAFWDGRILVRSDGTPWRPLVHVQDISSAFLAALAAPAADVVNQAMNVGANEENYRISDLANIVADTIPGSRVEYVPGGGPDKRCYRVDFSKIRKVLPAFCPQWDARKGAAQLYNAYKRAGLRIQDAGRFARLAEIRRLVEAGALSADLRRVPAGEIVARAAGVAS